MTRTFFKKISIYQVILQIRLVLILVLTHFLFVDLDFQSIFL